MQNNCFRKCSVRVPVCINNHDKLFQMQCFFMQHLETHQMRIINFLIHYIPFLKDLIRAKNLLPLFLAQKWNLHPMWPSLPPPLGKNNAVFPLPPTPSLLVSSFQSFGHLWNHQYYCHWTYCFLPFYWPRAHLVTCK